MRAWLDRSFGSHRLWLPLALAFLAVSLSRIDDGGTNSMARFSVLRAMSDEHTFRIDHFHDWTDDWARTPDGHYYSNKAPGPALVAFPLFWIIDQALKPIQERHPDEKGRRQAPRGIHKVAISTVFQVLPYLLLTLLALPLVTAGALTAEGYLWAALAILFGNTAAVLMSSYMGNPFAGMAMLGMGYFYLRGELAWMSFCFGWVVAADYTDCALVLPFAGLLWTEIRERGLAPVARAVAQGAAVPGALWSWYHTACFGSPFALPFKYDVQALSAKVENDPAGLWGKISFLPHASWLGELLVGSSRGLLVTQPWILVCVVALPFFRGKVEARLWRLFLFSVCSLATLLWLNAGFPGWHGGGSPGPRYLAGALPLFGLFLPALFQWGNRGLRALLAAAVCLSLGLRALVYATWILPPPAPLWPYYLTAIRTSKEWLLLLAFTAILGAAIFAYARRARALRGLRTDP